MSEDFYPFVDSGDPAPDNMHLVGGARRAEPVENDGESTEALEKPTYTTRISVYDDMFSTPRVIVVEQSDVRTYLEDVTNTVHRTMKEQGGHLSLMIIRELVENFIHAQFSEPVISILDDGDTIRFADQGPGINDKERAFEFGVTSADRSKKRYIRGTGAGLPMVQQYVEAAGGAISVEDNLGAGTVVTVSVNAARVAEIERAVSRGAAVRGGHHNDGAPETANATMPGNPTYAQPSSAAMPANPGQMAGVGTFPDGMPGMPEAIALPPEAQWPGAPAPSMMPAGIAEPAGMQPQHAGNHAAMTPGAFDGTGQAHPQHAMGTAPGQPAYANPGAQAIPGAPYPGYYQQGYPWPGTAQTGWQAYGNPANPYTMTGTYGAAQPYGALRGWQQSAMQPPQYPAAVPPSNMGGEAPEGPKPPSPYVTERGSLALRFIAQNGKGGPTDLTRAFGNSDATWSRELDTLAGTGLIYKRGQKYVLTELGQGWAQQQ